MAKTICSPDLDTARYLGDDTDGVYYEVAHRPGHGWYMSAVVDCNTGHFIMAMVTDAGPFATEAEAWDEGRYTALEWCLLNDVVHMKEEL